MKKLFKYFMLCTFVVMFCFPPTVNAIEYTNNTTIKVINEVSDSVSGMEYMWYKIGAGPWLEKEPFQPEKIIVLPQIEQEFVIYAQFSDKAGNESAVMQASVVLDTIPPEGSIRIEVTIQVDVTQPN